MTPAQRASLAITAALSGAAVATPLVIKWEGWETRDYADIIGVATACGGVTQGAKVGTIRSDAECQSKTAQALVQHAIAIGPCLPEQLPAKTRGAFVSFAYNVGVANFCGSTLSRKARGGDLAGACAELSRWTFAGGRKVRGLERRRADERAWCEEGLRAQA